ncbi:hypothetical protein ACHAXS_001156 [Conticribra weissflogii]
MWCILPCFIYSVAIPKTRQMFLSMSDRVCNVARSWRVSWGMNT